MSQPLPPSVRVVFFDAVGTLIHPHPAPGLIYAEIGQRHGSRLGAEEVSRRFSVAFRAEELRDANDGYRSSEAGEVARWRRIVATVLDDVTDAARCYAELYAHFARPDAWRCEPGTAAALIALRQAGYIVGVASNFDWRLRNLVVALPELATIEHVAISSELGWKKPAPAFFAALCAMTGRSAEQLLLVGDDWENDYLGARAAGMHGRLFDPRGRSTEGERIASLGELLRGAGLADGASGG